MADESRPESPAETVARIERIPAEERTKPQASALAKARTAVLQIEREGLLRAASAPPVGRSARAREDSTPGRSSDDLPTVTARIRDNIAREVDSLLANSVGLETSDRVKVLTAAARVTGFADSDDNGAPPPFASRGFVQPAVTLPTGAEPWTCGACGALHSPGGPVPADARVTETTQPVVPDAPVV